jgi:hypothetical protein
MTNLPALREAVAIYDEWNAKWKHLPWPGDAPPSGSISDYTREQLIDTIRALLDELERLRVALLQWQMGVGDTETERELKAVTGRTCGTCGVLERQACDIRDVAFLWLVPVEKRAGFYCNAWEAKEVTP